MFGCSVHVVSAMDMSLYHITWVGVQRARTINLRADTVPSRPSAVAADKVGDDARGRSETDARMRPVGHDALLEADQRPAAVPQVEHCPFRRHACSAADASTADDGAQGAGFPGRAAPCRAHEPAPVLKPLPRQRLRQRQHLVAGARRCQCPVSRPRQCVPVENGRQIV